LTKTTYHEDSPALLDIASRPRFAESGLNANIGGARVSPSLGRTMRFHKALIMRIKPLALAFVSVVMLGGLVAGWRAQVVNTSPGKVYVLIWFDTEDYILPQSDDAAKRLAVFLTQQGIKATFKVVGEKARTLERRGRRDVIGALAQHEIGYHSNTHSQHPTPAEYESQLDWEEGVEEFQRRERSGFDDLKRIFGQTPTCYGQPGSSWAPQSFAALKKWGVKVYLDEGGHVGMNGKPFWYGGLLNIFNTTEGAKLRPADDNDWSGLADARARFQEFYLRMTSKREGGVISLYFHPCEFIHKEFWDGVNFAHGANPPPEEWKLPPMKTPDESEQAFKFFEELVTYMKSFPRVEFLTASEALRLFKDAAQRRTFSPQELAAIARQVDPEVTFQVHDDYTLAASEVFFLLNKYVAGVVRKEPQAILLDGTPYGPASSFDFAVTRASRLAEAPLEGGATIDVPWNQFARTVQDVEEFLEKNDRVPSVVHLGSRPVSPESYLVALGQVTTRLLVRAEPPEKVSFAPARLGAGQYVADDSPQLWGWVIFPEGFHAPKMMGLAKLQAWTLKPSSPSGTR
jgi:peptidoglycan/xylan/chitin deacetylase (PgdA/CDA1 family)